MSNWVISLLACFISYALGTFKLNTDPAEFIPQERKNSGLNCGSQRRLDSNRIDRRNYSSSPPCHLFRQVPYDDISAVHQHRYHPSGSKPKSQQTSFQFSTSNKPLKSHGLQNQPWQKLRSEKQHVRVKRVQNLIDQTTSDAAGLESIIRSESGTDPREQSLSESEKEVGADPRGAKPKKATYSYGRGPKVKGKLKCEWGNRMTPKPEDAVSETLWSRLLSWGWMFYEDLFHMSEPLTGKARMASWHGWLTWFLVHMLMEKKKQERANLNMHALFKPQLVSCFLITNSHAQA